MKEVTYQIFQNVGSILGKIRKYKKASSIALANSISEFGIFNKIII